MLTIAVLGAHLGPLSHDQVTVLTHGDAAPDSELAELVARADALVFAVGARPDRVADSAALASRPCSRAQASRGTCRS